MSLDKEIFLTGERILLRPLTEDDIAGNYSAWLNNPEVTKYNSHGRFPMTVEKLQAFVRSARSSDSAITLAVIDRETASHIGNISLQAINWVDRNAEIAFLLGEPDFYGKGIMYDAGKLLINHGFQILNLHRIYCGTSADNLGMQKLAVRLGMLPEGIRKEAFFKNGRFVDVHEFGILNTNQ